MNDCYIEFVVDWNNRLGAITFWELFETIINWESSFFKHDVSGKSFSRLDVKKQLEIHDESFNYLCEVGGVSLSYVKKPKVEIFKLMFYNENTDNLIKYLQDFVSSGYFSWGYIYNTEYWLIQKKKDPKFLDLRGVDHSSWPKISNGLPFPLTREVIDISKSPGRHILTEGGVEAVGSIMWLSQKWLDAKQVNSNDVDALSKRKVSNGVLFNFYDKLFDSWEGEQKDIQNRIWRQLYNQDQWGQSR